VRVGEAWPINELFERIYRDIVDNACFYFSFMAKTSSQEDKRRLVSMATGHLQALQTVAGRLGASRETLDEIRVMLYGTGKF